MVTLRMEFRDKAVEVNAGEMIVVPMRAEHRPVANEEVWVIFFEPSNLKHTGNLKSHLTIENYNKI